MSPSLDSAILTALNLDKDHTTISSAGGSGFSSTFKLSTTKDGQPFDYFVKTGSGDGARVMFQGDELTCFSFSSLFLNPQLSSANT